MVVGLFFVGIKVSCFGVPCCALLGTSEARRCELTVRALGSRPPGDRQEPRVRRGGAEGRQGQGAVATDPPIPRGESTRRPTA